VFCAVAKSVWMSWIVCWPADGVRFAAIRPLSAATSAGELALLIGV
jgi:hypothetical protein